jgi:hypothetical protein
VRAKIGGVGSYAPQKGQGGGEATMFTLVMNFGDGRSQRLDMTPVNVSEDAARQGQGLEIPALTAVGDRLPLSLDTEDDVELGEDA